MKDKPIKRVVVYDIENAKPNIKTGHSNQITKKDPDVTERRRRALKKIENASELGKIIATIQSLNLSNPLKDGPLIQESVEKISLIIEDLKSDFKKEYWE